MKNHGSPLVWLKIKYLLKPLQGWIQRYQPPSWGIVVEEICFDEDKEMFWGNEKVLQKNWCKRQGKQLLSFGKPFHVSNWTNPHPRGSWLVINFESKNKMNRKIISPAKIQSKKCAEQLITLRKTTPRKPSYWCLKSYLPPSLWGT